MHRLDAAVPPGARAAGSALHAIADDGVPTREIAEVIGRHLGVPVVSIARDDAAEHFGFLGAFFALDVPASSAITRERMGWAPVQPGLIADLEQGHYFDEVGEAAPGRGLPTVATPL